MEKPFSRSCDAEIVVDFGQYFDNGKVRKLLCCLFAPHPKLRHYSPSLLLTIGGEVHKEEGWSHAVETTDGRHCITEEELRQFCKNFRAACVRPIRG